MTTWLEKFTYSTVKSTAVGKPVVSDSLVIPPDVLQAACCPQGSPNPENQGPLSSSSANCVDLSSSSNCPPSTTPTTTTTPTPCTSSDNSSQLQDGPLSSSSNCPPSSTPTTPTPCTSSDNSSQLQDLLVEMAGESEDEMCTDSEDEEQSDTSIC